MFMPQYNNGEGWWDMWHKPVDYKTAQNIRNMLMREGDDRKNLRILRVIA